MPIISAGSVAKQPDNFSGAATPFHCELVGRHGYLSMLQSRLSYASIAFSPSLNKRWISRIEKLSEAGRHSCCFPRPASHRNLAAQTSAQGKDHRTPQS